MPIGQEREPRGPIDQEGRLGWGLVQLEHPGEHCQKGHVLGSPAEDTVNNIYGKDKLAHTVKEICMGSGTPGP